MIVTAKCHCAAKGTASPLPWEGAGVDPGMRRCPLGSVFAPITFVYPHIETFCCGAPPVCLPLQCKQETTTCSTFKIQNNMKTLDFTGLNEKNVANVVSGLSQLLADLQVYYTNLR